MSDYYFKPSIEVGSGTLDNPYGNLSSIYSISMSNGDRVLLYGSEVYDLTGAISISNKSNIRFSTYGNQKATLNVSPGITGVLLAGTSGCVIENIDFIGSGHTSVSLQTTTNTGVTINNCSAIMPDWFVKANTLTGNLEINNCNVKYALKNAIEIRNGVCKLKGSHIERSGFSTGLVVSADAFGSVIDLGGTSGVDAEDCTFLNNKRAVYSVGNSRISNITRCNFISDSSTNLSSIGLNQNFVAATVSEVRINNSLFYMSGSHEHYAGVVFFGGNISFTECAFFSDMTTATSYFFVVPDTSFITVSNSLICQAPGVSHPINLWLNTVFNTFNSYVVTGTVFDAGLTNWTTYSGTETNSHLVDNPYLNPSFYKRGFDGVVLAGSPLVRTVTDFGVLGIDKNIDLTKYRNDTVGPWNSINKINEKKLGIGRLGKYGYTPK